MSDVHTKDVIYLWLHPHVFKACSKNTSKHTTNKYINCLWIHHYHSCSKSDNYFLYLAVSEKWKTHNCFHPKLSCSTLQQSWLTKNEEAGVLQTSNQWTTIIWLLLRHSTSFSLSPWAVSSGAALFIHKGLLDTLWMMKLLNQCKGTSNCAIPYETIKIKRTHNIQMVARFILL